MGHRVPGGLSWLWSGRDRRAGGSGGGFSLFSGLEQQDHPTTIYSQVQASTGSGAETLA